MGKYTPGPWHVEEVGEKPCTAFNVIGKCTFRKDLANIALITQGVAPNMTGEGNARLIAAAPDLLEAAEAAIMLSDMNWGTTPERKTPECQEVYNMVKAAIVKAKGEVTDDR